MFCVFKYKSVMQYYILGLLSSFCTLTSSLKCNKESGSYINFCGLCVVGSSSLKDVSGLDDCGICFGSNDCSMCPNSSLRNDCHKCLKWTGSNCTLRSNIFPSKIDLASRQHDVHFVVRGLDATDTSLNNVTCKMTNSNSANEYIIVNDTLIHYPDVHIAINNSLLSVGSYIIQCNLMTPENVKDLHASITVVDSKSLRIHSLVPQKVAINTGFEAMLSIHPVTQQQKDILCFLTVGDHIETIVKAEILSSGQILCKPLLVKSSSRVFLGISESLDAIMVNPAELSLVEIHIDNMRPAMRRSVFTPDLRQIHVQFDRNLESTQNCSEAFSEETQNLFGSGWQCWVKADKIVVQLGVESEVQPGSRITVISDNGGETSGNYGRSTSIASATIVDDVVNKVIGPLYNVLAPQVICYTGRTVGFKSSFLTKSSRKNDVKGSLLDDKSMTVIEVQELGGQNLVYNWSVNFVPSKAENSRSQRDMLLIWLSVRLLDRSVKKTFSNKVFLNNSLMLTGVDYTLTVKGINSLGMVGEEKRIPLRLSSRPNRVEYRSRIEDENFHACSSGSPLDVMLLSSPATFADAESLVELSLSCCDGVLVSDFFHHVEYIWSVNNTNGDEKDVMYSHGRRLVIPPNTLQGGNTYNISCVIIYKVNGEKLGYASTSLVTLERGIQININVSAVTISTKHPLIIDASKSIDLDNKPGNLEFKWSCRIATETSGSFDYGDKQCYVPGVQKALVSEKHKASFRQALLVLPPESLPIGRYLFSVEVMKKPYSSSSKFGSIDVTVVGGLPPLISLVSILDNENFPSILISPEFDVKISGFANGIKPGCHIIWTAVDKPGCSPLNHSLLLQEKFVAEVHDENIHEFPIRLSHGLSGDATYCLQLSAFCPSSGKLGVEMSSAVMELTTDAPPLVKPLKVEPLDGQALTTLFKFSTEPAYDDLLDCPLRYSFGFRFVEPNSLNARFFYSTTQHLSAFTYLPALSLSNNTKIQSLLRVCDVRHVCHIEEGPQVSTSAPKHLTYEHVEQMGESFSSLLLSEEYEDAVMVIENNMATLGILGDKSLFKLASQKIEELVSDQLKLIEERLDGSLGSVYAALRFLKVANAALMQGSFSKNTLQNLVNFKNRVLSMFNNVSAASLDTQVIELRVKRHSHHNHKSPKEVDQSWNFLQPEMVKALLSISEVAIFNLNDSKEALNEKQKLLQNVSFFINSLCRGLRNPTPIFIGSRVVSFSIQRLNLQVKYRDDLAIPDWRSAKSGGAPVNATAMVLLGEHVLHLVGKDTICMGAVFYPMDFLSDVFGKYGIGLQRYSAVYQVKLIPEITEQSRKSWIDTHDGLDIKIQSVQIKIPTWSGTLNNDKQLECRVWHHGEWSGHYCKLKKFVMLINKPAVECICSVIGYHAVFVSDASSSSGSTSASPSTSKVVPFTTTVATSLAPTFQPVANSSEMENSAVSQPTSPQPSSLLPQGIPIANTTQNFTFRIQEDFFHTVGSHREAFVSQLKRDILKQVEMPANMIAGIDVTPGSILVTLHLVDTDVRTVDDVLPTLAAVLHEGRLSVSGVDGRHLSVPPQSLQLLQRRSEHSFLPWIVIGCAVFSVLCVCSLVIAAVIVTRKQELPKFSNDTLAPVTKIRAHTYGRFHLEQTLEGSEATISRYRSSNNNPLVVSTIGGLASAMGTNAKIPDSYQAASLQYKIQPLQGESKNSSSQKEMSGSSSQSNSSGNNSTNNVQRRSQKSSHKLLQSSSEDRQPILSCEEEIDDPDENDSGIIIKDCGNKANGSIGGSHHSCNSLNGKVAIQPEVLILPGTPTDKGTEPVSQ